MDIMHTGIFLSSSFSNLEKKFKLIINEKSHHPKLASYTQYDFGIQILGVLNFKF